MDKTLEKLRELLGTSRVKVDEPMRLHATFKIGGPAQLYLEVETIEDLVASVTHARNLGVSVFIVGGGSNIIVSDKGIKGLVIKNNCRKFDVASMGGKIVNGKIDVSGAFVMAQSGVIMNQLVRFTVDQGLGGLEYQLGLPGTVGGAVCMNSNFPLKQAYMGDCVYRAKLLTPEGEIKEVDNSYFHFAYDYSILQKTGDIVLSVIFKLVPMDTAVLKERSMEAMTHRSGSQPKGLSAGCTFRNISILEAMTVPTPGRVTSAGYLIDKAGLKGKRIGDAKISDMHANFIMNMGNAKAEDIIALVELIKEEVKKKFNVGLHMEVKKIGF